VYAVLYKAREPSEAVRALLERDAKEEIRHR